jgi:hypothetical protein
VQQRFFLQSVLGVGSQLCVRVVCGSLSRTSRLTCRCCWRGR